MTWQKQTLRVISYCIAISLFQSQFTNGLPWNGPHETHKATTTYDFTKVIATTTTTPAPKLAKRNLYPANTCGFTEGVASMFPCDSN